VERGEKGKRGREEEGEEEGRRKERVLRDRNKFLIGVGRRKKGGKSKIVLVLGNSHKRETCVTYLD
jgi:hypothetical protein